MRGILFLFAFVLSWPVFAQPTVNRYQAPLAGTVILRDVQDKYNAHVSNLEAADPDESFDKIRLEQAKEQVAQRFPFRRDPGTTANKTTAINGPAVTIGFVADSLNGVPPDNYMAISKADVAVSVVNSSIAVINGQTGKMNFRKNLNPFTPFPGFNNNDNNRFDPKIIYDPEADRFICVMLNNQPAINDSSWTFVGFSQTNDPTGAWKFYVFPGTEKDDTCWFDYPAIAITKDEFFLTGNKIRFNTSWQAGFKETVIYQIKKQDGYSGAANLTYQIWDNINFNGAPIRNLFPVKNGSAIGGPAQYFLSNRNFDVQNDTVFLVKLPGVIGSGGSLSIKALKADQAYGVPPNGRQVDTFTLATNDGRILGAYLEGNEIQFVSTSVFTATGASAVYHGKIMDYDGNPTLETKFFTIDTLDFGYPNISFAGNPWGLNQSLISFNYTGPNTYAGLGAIVYDGTQFSPLVKVKEGDSSIRVLTGKEQRWGDYSGSQPDWNSYGSVWIEGIYGRRDQKYGNWMARLNSPLLDVVEKEKAKVSSVVYPNPAVHYISLDFKLREEGVYSFSIYNAAGKSIDKILSTHCEPGMNRIQFNIQELPAGNYFLKGQDDKGNIVLTQRFIRQ